MVQKLVKRFIVKATTSDRPSSTSWTSTWHVASLAAAEAEQRAELLFPFTAHGGDEHSATLLKQVALAGSGALLFCKVFVG